MIDTVIRTTESSKWPHEYRVGKVRFRSRNPFSIDINPDYTLDTNQLLVTGEIARRKQMMNILGTPIGSEDFEPLYGSNLPYRLFEPINDINAQFITLDTIVALDTWMRGSIRILAQGTDVIPTDSEDGYLVNINFEITETRVTTAEQFEVLR